MAGFAFSLSTAADEDLYIGEVDKVEDVEEELIKKITVKPAIDFKKLFRVFIITD